VRQKWLILPAALFAAFAFTGAAPAQYDYYRSDEAAKTWSVHAGAAFFRNRPALKDRTNLIVGVEGERPVGAAGAGSEGRVTLSADYIPLRTVAEGTVSIVPVLIGYKAYTPMGGYRAFFGASIGTRWAGDDVPALRIRKGFRFGWGGGAGVNISPDLLAQVRFLAGEHPSDDGAWTVELGYRF